MASTYENDLRLEEMATGENSGSWGTKTNTNLELVADAFSYGTEIIADADTAITIADGAADAARSLALKINSSEDLTTTRVVTLGPNTTSKVWIIENNTSGGQTLTISAGSGSNITLENGRTKIIATDGIGAGSNVVELTQDLAIADLFVDGDLTVDTDTLYVDSTNNRVNVGNGRSSATAASNADDLVVEASGDGGISILNPASNTGTLFFGDPSAGNAGQIKYSHSSDSMSIVTSQNTAMTIDSSQEVLINKITASDVGSTASAKLQINAASILGLTILTTAASTGPGGTIALGHGRGDATTALQEDDIAGEIRFSAADGTDLENQVAHIRGMVDGTVGTNDTPGRLVFATAPSGAGTSTERMRISQGGQVSIGVSDTPATTSALQVFSGAAGRSVFRHASGDGGVVLAGSAAGSGASLIFGNTWDDATGSNFVEEYRLFHNGTNDSLEFNYNANASKAMVLTSSGRVLIGGETDFAVAGRERLLVEHTDGGGISMRRLDSSIVADDTLGRINFYGSDGASVGNDGIGAAIVAKAAGTFAANDFPTNLAFFNNVDNAENLVENLTIRYDGHVGINDTSPSTILSVKDDNTIVQIAANGGTAQSYFIVNANRDSATQHLAEVIGQWNGTSVGRIVIAAGDDTTNKDDGEITFYTAPSGTMTRRMVIRNNGNIGIGNDVGTDPVNPSNFGTALEIGDNDGGSLVLTDTNTTTNKKSFFMSSKGTKFNLGTMNDDGTGDAGIFFLDHTTQHVGIGTDDPETKFAVYDDTTWDAATFKSNTGTGAGFTLNSTSTGVEWSLIAQGTAGGADDNNLGYHLTNAGTSGQSTGYKFSMNANGDLKIFDGNLIVGTGGHGIDFSAQTATSASGATTDSELLDHYEEGSWQPTVQGSSTTGTVTGYTARVGWYTRIGNIVQIHCTIACNGFTGVGSLLVNGLPFNTSSASVDSVFSMQWNSVQWSGPSSSKQTVIPMIFATNSGKLGFRASDYQSGVAFSQVSCLGSSSTIEYMRITGWYRLGTT